MTAARFSACLAFWLKAEGGYSDNPDDPGGPTCCGITSQTLAEYLGRPVSIKDVRALNPGTVSPIYERLYWQPVQGDKLPPGVDLFVSDTAINMGVGTAARMLQTALGVTVDGDIGPVTLAAPALAYPRAVIQKLSKLREARYRADPKFSVFGKGWLARLAAVTAQASADAVPQGVNA
jgi:lysozyme family protein